jgi:hypothetical protein
LFKGFATFMRRVGDVNRLDLSQCSAVGLDRVEVSLLLKEQVALLLERVHDVHFPGLDQFPFVTGLSQLVARHCPQEMKSGAVVIEPSKQDHERTRCVRSSDALYLQFCS